MAKRETYTTNIQCEECGAKGTGSFTENENPVFTRGRLDRVTDSVSGGFSLNSGGKQGISCEGCGSLMVVQA